MRINFREDAVVWKRCIAIVGFAILSSLPIYGSSAISVSIKAAATSVDLVDSVKLTATVTNDVKSAGVTWKVSGGGALSGTTTTTTTYTAPSTSTVALTITVTATSKADTTKSATQKLTVPLKPTITTTALTAGTVGTAYSVKLAGSGGISPYTWSLSSGTLPSGLSLAKSTGLISGTPKAAGVGTTKLTFMLTDSGAATALTTTKTLSLTVKAAMAITFTTTSLSAASYKTAYSAKVVATGGAGTLTYSVSSGKLPTGLTLTASTGAIAGTPTATGSFASTIKAADAYGDSATKSYTIKVSYTAVSITTTTLASGTIGKAYTATLAAKGGSGTGYTWALGSSPTPPSWLKLSSAGAVSGTPTAAATSSFKVTVTDSAKNTASATLSITATAAALTISTTILPAGVASKSYAQTIAVSGGASPYTYAVSSSSLPKWATLGGTTGKISGTPSSSQTGSTSFTVKVTDSAKKTATVALVLTVYKNSGEHNSYFNGHYAFHASGWRDGTDVGATYKAALAGSFLADGKGYLTSGVVDFVDAVGNTGKSTFTGTYALDTANRGKLTLNFSSGKPVTISITAGGLTTAGLATTGAFIQFDDINGIGKSGYTRMTGEFARQTTTDFTTAKLSGGYAFGVDGETCPIGDIASSLLSDKCLAAKDQGTLSVAGVLKFSGTGTIVAGSTSANTGSMEDISVGGEGVDVRAGDYQVPLSGSYGTPDSSTGRTTLTLSTGSPLPTSDKAIWPTHFVVYIVNASKLYLLSIDAHNSYALMSGTALKQTVSSFSASNLSGNSICWGVQPNGSYSYRWGTSSATSAANESIGRIVANSSKGTISATILNNDAGTIASGSATGAYTVASNGRVTVTIAGDTESMIFYLSATNTGFSTGHGNSHADLSTLEPQTATAVTAGNFVVTNFSAAPATDVATGILAVTAGSKSYLGTMTLDQSEADGTLLLDQVTAATVTIDSNGLMTMKGVGSWGYVISSTRMVGINLSSSNSNPEISTMQQ